MSQRIHCSDHVPGVLTAALAQLKARPRKAALKSAPVAFVNREATKLPLRTAIAKKKLVAHGAGVYEDRSNGDIWFRDGEFLVRQAIDTNDLVEKYLATCQGK